MYALPLCTDKETLNTPLKRKQKQAVQREKTEAAFVPTKQHFHSFREAKSAEDNVDMVTDTLWSCDLTTHRAKGTHFWNTLYRRSLVYMETPVHCNSKGLDGCVGD